MKVLVAGCGYVGTELARRLRRSGHEVFGLRRDVTALPAGVVPVAADLERPETLVDLPRGIDHVVFCAGARQSDENAYRSIYVAGLSNLIEALRLAGAPVRRLLFTSSTAVYAQSDGEDVDEDSITAPTHFSGRRLLEAERLLAGSGLHGIVLRLAGIYGPERAGLVARVARGTARYSEPPRFTNRIHRDDCAGAIEHLLFHPDPEPLYVGADEDPADERTVLEWLAAEFGTPAPSPGESPARSDRPMSSKRCRSYRLLRSGYSFAFPSFRAGYRALLGEFATGVEPR
jgi:nucleoside-diphosphate-sugar epimerase